MHKEIIMEVLNIIDMAIHQGGFKLVLALLGLIMCRVALISMDIIAPRNFKDWLKNADHQSKAIYYGSRLICVGIIVGSAVS